MGLLRFGDSSRSFILLRFGRMGVGSLGAKSLFFRQDARRMGKSRCLLKVQFLGLRNLLRTGYRFRSLVYDDIP